MDPGYNPYNRQVIINNAEYLNIPIRMFETQIFDIVATVVESPCYLCARMRRGHLYKHAQELGCNKIALGHHFDDVIETTLMSMLYSGQFKTMMPKLHSTNFEGMELIRPLYLVKEADIIAWKKHNNLQFIQCACRFTENCMLGDNGGGSKRVEMKELIKKFRQTDPIIEMNIFRSIHNVNLDTVIGFQKNHKQFSFLDEYDNNTNRNMDMEK
jgi:tRNA(Ile)-lysidine synthase TilS/MesJ